MHAKAVRRYRQLFKSYKTNPKLINIFVVQDTIHAELATGSLSYLPKSELRVDRSVRNCLTITDTVMKSVDLDDE